MPSKRIPEVVTIDDDDDQVSPASPEVPSSGHLPGILPSRCLFLKVVYETTKYYFLFLFPPPE